MKISNNYIYAIILLSLFSSAKLAAQMKDREAISTNDQWDLKPLYASEEDWENAKKTLQEKIPELSANKGRLTSSSQTLAEGLKLYSDLRKDATRLWTYAILNADKDTRVVQYQSMVEESLMIYHKVFAESSFMAPEILEADEQRIRAYIKENKALEEHRFFLEDLFRRKAHLGTKEEENIIAKAGTLDENTSNVYNTFMNAEFPHREITLSSGEQVALTQTNYSRYRASPSRQDREMVMENFFSTLGQFQNTLGSTLYGSLKKDLFYTNARNYNSSLELTLDEDNIPVEIYHKLIEEVNNNLDVFHRYLEIRKRILGLDQLHYYDLYAPLLEGEEVEYAVDEAKEIILASLQPLGDDYMQTIRKAFDEGWIDLYPTEGKKSGAYSSGLAYEVHPYILINYNHKHEDLSTLTHELGHAMHTHYANQHQPFTLAHYPIFVAEIASTFNEALLNDYLLKHTEDPARQLMSMGNFLDNARGDLFRAVQFAEFELEIHTLTQKGEALSGEKFNEIYEAITKKYYGHDKGICIVDDYIQTEWAYIPHFYTRFYQYQYATSFIASQALSEKVISGEEGAADKYLHFLSRGGSDYPAELLKEAGVDLSTQHPFNLTFQKMNKVMDEMEKILDQLGK